MGCILRAPEDSTPGRISLGRLDKNPFTVCSDSPDRISQPCSGGKAKSNTHADCTAGSQCIIACRT